MNNKECPNCGAEQGTGSDLCQDCREQRLYNEIELLHKKLQVVSLTEVDGQLLWKLFVDEVWKDAHIKLPLENFLGSVNKHKKFFKKAMVRFNAGEKV